jgi:glucose-6-phosphate 1-epimerase
MERLPDGARLETGPGGLERLSLAAPSGDADIYLQGAHVAHFQPNGHGPVLWMSRESRYEAGKPLRGGVPICFPWFGPKAGAPEAPLHGFARIRPWTLREVTPAAGGALRAVLAFSSGEATRAHFPHDFAALFTVTVGATLRMELAVTNAGREAFSFEQALHTYLAVGDVRQARITGLEATGFVDKTDAMGRKPAEGRPLAIAAETDRVYLGTTDAVTVEDPAMKRRLVIGKSGSRTTVVWNPWVAKAKAMPDFGDEEWPGMLCVETANAMDDAVTLAPGAAHALVATVEVQAG